MKFETLLQRFVFAALMLATVSLIAQVAAPAVPPLAGIGTDQNTIWVLAISFVTPLIVTGIKNLAPKVPGWALPASTPLIGIVLGLVLQYFGKANLSWFDMAKAGALAVMIRETWDQAAQAVKPAEPPTS